MEVDVHRCSVDIALGARAGIPLFCVLMSYEPQEKDACDMDGSIDTVYLTVGCPCPRVVFGRLTKARLVIRGYFIYRLYFSSTITTYFEQSVSDMFLQVWCGDRVPYRSVERSELLTSTAPSQRLFLFSR